MRDRIKAVLKGNLRGILIFVGIVIFFLIGSRLGIDRSALAVISVVVGLITKAFVGILAVVALIPVVGPAVVNVITMPFFLTVNAIAYLATLLAVRKGYARDVIDSRVLVITLLLGIVIGFLLGRFL